MPSPAAAEVIPLPRRAFAHASEAEMSRILDFYGVQWHYEPTTFPILWNQEGEVVESFSPDFFLPEFDLYLEMTTLKQSLVRKKNRKLRRLRELYPDIRIKLFYARDFRAMMLKYGRLGLAQSLSGASGQLVGGERLGDLSVAEPIYLALPEPGPELGNELERGAEGGTGVTVRRRRGGRSVERSTTLDRGAAIGERESETA
jgi:hypothetical protein